jgi:hypothetical protein
MKNKINTFIERNYRDRFFSIILLSFFLCGQSHCQWQKLNFPDSVQVNTLAVVDSNIFAGTDGDGIFLSTDNGKNWESINDGLQSYVIHKIFLDGITIFAGTDSGAYISTDKGFNWNPINSGLSGLGVWSFAVSKSIFGDSTYLAGTWNGIYSSTDRGKNWKATGLSYTTMPVHSIIVKDNFIFAATLGSGVFKSQDNGFTWSDISIVDTNYFGVTSLVPVYSLALIDTNLIAGAGPGYFFYTSFHNTIFDTVSIRPKLTKPILCFAVHNSRLFAGSTIGNIFLSNIDGTIWRLISPSLQNQSVYSLALNNSYIFAGSGNGVWRLSYPETTTNIKSLNETPTGFALEQNYPNPFNPSTTIKYNLPSSRQGERSGVRFVTLKIYNLLGKEVAMLVNELQAPGNYEVKFNGSNLASGVYIYRLQAGNFVSIKKLMILK